MLNIAVVGNNADMRAAVLAALSGEGHQAVGVARAEALAEEADFGGLDLLLVDQMLPGEDGISLSRRLRAIRPEMGIVMLTEESAAADRALGYRSGADLCLAKPVALEELCAAVDALGRRLKAVRAKAPLIAERQALLLRGPAGEQRLSASEATLLAAFVDASERRLEASRIVQLVGGGERDLSRNTLNVMIFRLAAKLKQVGAAERPIRAIRNWGYQLCEDVALG